MRPFLAALVLLFITGPAQAGFTVCNKAHVTAKIAFGRFDGRAWASQGWWTIRPQKCETLLTGPLDARYYYLYGTDGGSGTWNGGTYFCTAPAERFTIPGRADCAARGYDRKGFFAVDTGNRADWKQSLSD
jgi:uncharacterized membrane protein